ncbi:thiol-disulfide oxidoreductase DCC family protein [Streptomyces sp. NPDC058221]|uniref:thiol-disulfide oxidoreductase DCC family protein n=1 Tax=Streptomyces sp. NPDC058221 TaxID=3346388 RepID=UPI0036E92C81
MRPGTGGRRQSVERLTVLYDAQCPLCVHLRQWLMRQRQLIPLDLVPADSAQAHRLFPGLDHAGTLEEITVIGDGGQIYRSTSAWIVCLWALAEHRPKSHWLTTPAGRPFARATVLAAAKYRSLTAAPCRADGGGACVAEGPEPGAGPSRIPSGPW